MQPPRGPEANLEENSLPTLKKLYDGQIMMTSARLIAKGKVPIC